MSQFFLNPAYVIPAAALLAVPVLIHLLSRLRYKRVRFAAMEFLLESDELNRRRIVIEQLLLLALRTLAVLLIGLLIARLILDPNRMLMLRGSSVHHVVLLDDSLSMRDRDGDDTVFRHALTSLESMLAEGSSQPGTARITILSMSDPLRPILSDRPLDGAVLQELLPRLRNLTCSWRSASPVPALLAAKDILAADASASPQVHVLTDFRATDWTSRPEVTAALESLRTIQASVTLIPMTQDARPNVALVELSSETVLAARGVPWRMTLSVRNHSTTRVTGLRAVVLRDGLPLPGRVLIPDIEPGDTQLVAHDLTFETEGRHQVEVRLDDDTLREDNRRFLAVDVSERRQVLIVDDDGRQDDAAFVAAALSADPELTGLAAEVRPAQALSSISLDAYDCVFLLNIRELPADITRLLADYVEAGGGIAWFPGDQANARWYSETLREPSLRLFPVPLGVVQEATPELSGPATNSGGDESPFAAITFSQHPVFLAYNVPDSPFADVLRIRRWLAVTDEWVVDDAERNDQVRTLARLGNGQPVVFEHSCGRGRVLTFLFGSGRNWSNWPVAPAAPGYVVTMLLIHQYLQRETETIQLRELTEPLKLEWPTERFTDNVEVFLPEAGSDEEPVVETFVRLQATSASAANRASQTNDTDAQNSWSVTIQQAERPGLYRLRRFTPDGTASDTTMVLNVPSTESALSLADAERLTQQTGMDHVRVADPKRAGSLGGNQAGREIRWMLIGLLIATLLCEQLLALRLSYHPEAAR